MPTIILHQVYRELKITYWNNNFQKEIIPLALTSEIKHFCSHCRNTHFCILPKKVQERLKEHRLEVSELCNHADNH